MRRRVARHAEVIDGGDQALAEQVLPDAVDHHARGERVLRAGQPLGQLEPAALLGIDLRCVRGHSSDREEAARHDRPELLGLAADADLGVADGLGVAHAQGELAAIGRRVGQREQLVLEPVHLLPRRSPAWAGRSGPACRPSRLVDQRLEFGLGLRHGVLGLLDLRRRLADRRRIFGPSLIEHRRCRSSPGRRRPSCCARRRRCRCCGRCRPGRNSRSVGIGSNLWSWQRAQLDRQAEERPADGVDLLVDVVHDEPDLEPLVDVLARRAPGSRWRSAARRVLLRVAAGSRSPAICSRMNWSYGLSRVERVDDVIAIPPGVGIGQVAGRAGRFAVAGDVEPVPAPALAEVRRGQQPIDQPSRRRPGEASSRKASISSGVGGRPVRSKVTRRIRVSLSASPTGLSPSRSSRGQDEAVDVVGRPRRRRARRGPGSVSGCQAQCFLRSSSYFAFGLPRRRRRPSTASGQAAPSLIHRRQVGDLLRREAASSGASSGCVLVVADGLEEQALFGLARDDGRPAVAAVDQAVAVVDPQAALGVGVGRMAGVAVVHQHRPDLLLEELAPPRRQGASASVPTRRIGAAARITSPIGTNDARTIDHGSYPEMLRRE